MRSAVSEDVGADIVTSAVAASELRSTIRSVVRDPRAGLTSWKNARAPGLRGGGGRSRREQSVAR